MTFDDFLFLRDRISKVLNDFSLNFLNKNKADRACNPYLGQVETIVMNESGSIVFQQDDYNDTMDSNMNGNRKLRARKVEAISFPIQNETEGLKVRECKCTDSYDRAFDTIGNFYCPLKYSSSCVIIHNETMGEFFFSWLYWKNQIESP